MLLGILTDASSVLCTRLSRSVAAFSKALHYGQHVLLRVPLPQSNKFDWFGLFRFRSPLLTESLRFLLLGLLRCFTSPRVAFPGYALARKSQPAAGGFPHSEISGSKPACGSPKHIAACCVLHRLSAPRHSPSALCSLIETFSCPQEIINNVLRTVFKEQSHLSGAK